jgi:protocatechuate 3,4-dioxygenase beta subunit
MDRPAAVFAGMTSRLFALPVTLFITAAAGAAQDTEFLRALERAQQQRPATLSANARIAAASEPGTPLVIHGRVFATDARTPIPHAIVFAYHTDRAGNYDARGAAAHSWRLKGWARADADGRFEFQTIRPAPYPNGRIPAHVHLTVFLPSGERYHAGELQFEDDQLVPAADREKSKSLGGFGSVLPIRREGDTQHVDFQIKADPRQKF